MTLTIKEVPIEEVLKVNATVPEWDESYTKTYFKERYKGKKKLVIVAYLDGQPAGYLVGYDRFDDGSFYCWMTGVDPRFRRRGLLKSLMEYEDRWAQRKGYKKIVIKTRNRRREMFLYLVKYGFNAIRIEEHPEVEDYRIYFEKAIS